ncbi:MAG: Peptidase M50 [Candidatus Wolfebacteria bacterium GW2011_GWE1_48_7]|uniref:Peptidase M50 n=2 Tax=Candidatus Wolfeibacteriota TaxID=1752735 RepID=A0A0G1X4N4_9BACT|nr:MAG: peptidase M50 [Candidatus Wolfebacteria bacterium GW2011_GWB1_47_1]KKU41460.1 MAG: Peptidase M50 [Candidatus Wolfebacteria bacterium GW2011_GWB2_46_69]KKU58833.1 MAG: Peptidase M50 [Candidatus Wolfebacteria bacterium GW2011_GWE2_47_12]KKU65426.1 MAG: Peptidase M50 [Candidatus Wolfebacteria bacterium GW2011_GWD2_47_17]KKU71120.1 MAG: Peptidase M50 [Candidatus Wolfebacteria bacterium GW2011_GWB1_47_243]KKU89385.1 MAG: Peptidase M50 [Candidatus Wolfebacteria bacterium GW2011_GWA2_47_9b]K
MIIPFFYLFVFLFAAIIHEVAHGAMAYKLGDPTAKDAGRLTLNPIRHIDPVGSILLPLILYIMSSPILFGWAKPVPFNPVFLRNPKRDGGLIALSGPMSNFAVAAIFYVIMIGMPAIGAVVPNLPTFLSIIIYVNMWLGIINLVPLPPLDGSKVLFMILPKKWYKVELFLEKNGPMLLMALIFILIFFF